jgi:hypothetical protein
MPRPGSTREPNPETIPTPNADGDRDNGRCWCGFAFGTARRTKLKASMRSLIVVVPHILVEDPLKMAPTPDQHPVQALLPHGSYPPLGERVGVRRLDRRRDGPDAVAGKHVVERAGDLAVAVTDEEPRCAGHPSATSFSVHRELSCTLDHPQLIRMVGDADESNLPGVQLDGEQDIEGREAHRLDGDEVDRQDGRGLGAKERPPGDRGPSGRRPEPVAKQHRSDAGR